MLKEIKKYEYNGKVYEYKLTLSAKVELEQRELNKSKKIFQGKTKDESKSLSNIMKKYRDLEKARKEKNEKLVEEIQQELTTEAIPLLDVVGDLKGNETEDLKEVMYILLKNHKNYKGEMTKELSDEIIEDMEDKVGIKETWQFMLDVKDIVFQQIEDLNKALEKKTN